MIEIWEGEGWARGLVVTSDEVETVRQWANLHAFTIEEALRDGQPSPEDDALDKVMERLKRALLSDDDHIASQIFAAKHRARMTDRPKELFS